jgi:hypothetical protein
MSNQDPAVLEREKQKNLKGEQDHSPHPETAPKWNEALAVSGSWIQGYESRGLLIVLLSLPLLLLNY